MQFGSDINESKLQNGDSRLAIDMRIGEMPSRYNTTEEAQKYEIVKLAAPQPALLSRQMINAIDQAAEAESVERHQSVRSRIYEIVDRGFGELSSSLTDEKHARHILGRMPRILHFDAIRTLALTCEPFWSALLYTNAQASLSELGGATRSIARAQLADCRLFASEAKDRRPDAVGPLDARRRRHERRAERRRGVRSIQPISLSCARRVAQQSTRRERLAARH